MNNMFVDITILTVCASIIGVLFRIIKQPPILAYILAGIVLGPLALNMINDKEGLESISELGITLLLFMIGLELRVKELKSVGKTALITGIGQILFTGAIGYLLATILQFSPLTSLYVSIGVTFSSTIIVVKLLSDKKDLNSLYGKISIGFLLVQDFFAIIGLVILSSLQDSDSSITWVSIIFIFLKAIALFAVVIYLSNAVFPKAIRFLSRSQELLFISSLGWAFGISALVSSDWVGFSIEIGGFLAGLSLANSTETTQIISKVRSLRDFFVMIFFVLLGMQLVFDDIGSIIFPAALLSIFVLVGNPLIVMALLGIQGYKKRTSFLSGLTVGQISEFSLILMFIGNKLGHISDSVVSLMTIIGITTFTLSTYGILNGNSIYNMIKNFLGVFERKHSIEYKYSDLGDLNDHIIIIGAHRIGLSTLKTLYENEPQTKDNTVIVDFNPDRIKELSEEGYKIVFGDIADTDIQDKVKIESAKLIFSTVPDFEDNLILLNSIKLSKSSAKIIVTAQYDNEIHELYNAGADYVVMPYNLAGKLIGKLLISDSLNILNDNRKRS